MQLKSWQCGACHRKGAVPASAAHVDDPCQWELAEGTIISCLPEVITCPRTLPAHPPTCLLLSHASWCHCHRWGICVQPTSGDRFWLAKVVCKKVKGQRNVQVLTSCALFSVHMTAVLPQGLKCVVVVVVVVVHVLSGAVV
jgi:hypothetical protein